MINLQRIEKASLRFRNFCDQLQFRAVEVEQKDKNSAGQEVLKIVWEVKQGPRTLLTSTEEECKLVTNNLNSALSDVLQAEYDHMMNELKEADTT